LDWFGASNSGIKWTKNRVANPKKNPRGFAEVARRIASPSFGVCWIVNRGICGENLQPKKSAVFLSCDGRPFVKSLAI